MTQKRLSVLTEEIPVIKRIGTYDPLVSNLTYDSRNVKKGYLFFALIGAQTDGHNFIPEAEQRGAVVIVHSRPVQHPKTDIVYLQVERTRDVVAPIAAAFFEYPSEELYTIGVTGTDGKSTTVSMTYQLLEDQGFSSGFLSTVAYRIGDAAETNRFSNTTPEAVEIQRLLRQMILNNKQYAVIEASSHGLSRKNNRLGNIAFDCAVLTNISHEHLEFHGSFTQYIDDKANLFRALNLPRRKSFTPFGVINFDDPHAVSIAAVSDFPIYTFSMNDRSADICVLHTKAHTSRTIHSVAGYTSRTIHSVGTEVDFIFRGDRFSTFLPLPGLFNVENLLASLLSVHIATGTSMQDLIRSVEKLTPVPGRMITISRGQPFFLLVDFAHTPAAFSRLLPAVKRKTVGKLYVVFGSAGERDREKRALQGAIADTYADVIILTDEDPRHEDPRTILEEIASACSNHTENQTLFLIPDRKDAIRKAFSLAGVGDSVVLLGKGHENGIIYGSKTRPWNECGAAEDVLAEMGFSRVR